MMETLSFKYVNHHIIKLLEMSWTKTTKKAGNTLFCLHRGFIFMHSPVLEGILSIPPSIPNDGTEIHPIVLDRIVSERDFTYFVSWAYHACVNPTPIASDLTHLTVWGA